MGSNRLLPPNMNEEAHSPDDCWQTYRQHEGDQSESKADMLQKAETITGKLRQILYLRKSVRPVSYLTTQPRPLRLFQLNKPQYLSTGGAKYTLHSSSNNILLLLGIAFSPLQPCGSSGAAFLFHDAASLWP